MDNDFQLGRWLVKPNLNSVFRDGKVVQIEPKVMSVLVCLAAHAPEPVPKEKLLQEVWPDTFVGEGVLTRSISELRRVFEDEVKEPRVIQTIAKGGYRLLATVVPGRRGQNDSVAVFPLANAAANPDTEYLLSGIPGSIIRGLSPIPNLTVVAGGMAPGFEGREVDAQTIGNKFNVQAALLGRVLQRRTKLRLQVDLVDTKTGEQLWADQYDRDFAELFVVQESIVKEVSKQLRLNLGGEDARLMKRHTENAEAYRLYLRGRHCFLSRTAEGLRKASEYFKSAIQLDPQYALAYAELAAVCYLPGYYGMVRPRESFPIARAAAEKALELDHDLPEAHEALATLNLFEWRWAEAEEEYRRCLEVNPNHTLSHYHYAMCLSELGRFPEAINEATEAQIRDPLSGPANAGLAWTLWAARQYDKSLQQSLIATELDPHSMFARVTAGVAYEQNGMYPESIAEFQKGIEKNGSSMFYGFQGHAFARSGDSASAWNNIHTLQELSRDRYVAPSHLAITYAGLEEKDLAIQSLHTAYENQDSFLVFSAVLPQFDNLRSDPRFDDLLRRMNFPS